MRPLACVQNRNKWRNGLIILLVAAVAGAWVWWKFEDENARMIAQYEAERASVNYTATLYPATVIFPRGPVRQENLYGPTPWRGLRAEIATCRDDSEGRYYVEFYQVDDSARLVQNPFADETHPAIEREYVRTMDVDPKSTHAQAIVLAEEDFEGWKLRSTLVPTPYGGVIIPKDLSPAILARLSAIEAPDAPKKDPGIADPRFVGASSGSRRFGAKTNDVLQRDAETKAEREYNSASRTFDERHHHFYLAEAVRDFGHGRVVILRRFGQVYGDETISRAVSQIKEMASTIKMPES